MELFRQYAERKRRELMEKAASKLNGKVDASRIEIGGDAMDREYNGQPFISRTLNDSGIRPR